MAAGGRKPILPYEIKTIDGRRLYKIEEGRWVSRQRAHQIWHGYSPVPVGPVAQENLRRRAQAEREKYAKKQEDPS